MKEQEGFCAPDALQQIAKQQGIEISQTELAVIMGR